MKKESLSEYAYSLQKRMYALPKSCQKNGCLIAITWFMIIFEIFSFMLYKYVLSAIIATLYIIVLFVSIREKNKYEGLLLSFSALLMFSCVFTSAAVLVYYYNQIVNKKYLVILTVISITSHLIGWHIITYFKIRNESYKKIKVFSSGSVITASIFAVCITVGFKIMLPYMNTNTMIVYLIPFIIWLISFSVSLIVSFLERYMIIKRLG